MTGNLSEIGEGLMAFRLVVLYHSFLEKHWRGANGVDDPCDVTISGPHFLYYIAPSTTSDEPVNTFSLRF